MPRQAPAATVELLVSGNVPAVLTVSLICTRDLPDTEDLVPGTLLEATTSIEDPRDPLEGGFLRHQNPLAR